VLLPALPGRSRPANASPPETSGRSRNANSGWKPNVRFHVFAAFSLSSEWEIVTVASKSICSNPARSGPAPAAHARARAAARAASTPGRCSLSIRSSIRQVVGMLATSPHTWCRSPKTSIWETQSAPSAMATAMSANTSPGACSQGPA
jgi:hypothetical protein